MPTLKTNKHTQPASKYKRLRKGGNARETFMNFNVSSFACTHNIRCVISRPIVMSSTQCCLVWKQEMQLPIISAMVFSYSCITTLRKINVSVKLVSCLIPLDHVLRYVINVCTLLGSNVHQNIRQLLSKQQQQQSSFSAGTNRKGNMYLNSPVSLLSCSFLSVSSLLSMSRMAASSCILKQRKL